VRDQLRLAVQVTCLTVVHNISWKGYGIICFTKSGPTETFFYINFKCLVLLIQQPWKAKAEYKTYPSSCHRGRRKADMVGVQA
jgi:hypothetical protein